MEPVINCRRPDVDRFIEIIATSKRYGLYFNAYVKDIPNCYDLTFLKELDILSPVNEDIADFYHKYINDFNSMFEQPKESIEVIKERIVTTKNRVISLCFDICGTSKTMLEKAFTEQKLTCDQINNIIQLSAVIAAMDERAKGKINPQHTAEAVGYGTHPNHIKKQEALDFLNAQIDENVRKIKSRDVYGPVI